MFRNLFYNCCPHVDAEEVWLDNIRWLCKYGRAFNNKILINIKTGKNMADPEFVKSRFAELEWYGYVEFCLVPNNAESHELAGFLEGLEKLKSDREDEITFYAHTKGVRKAVVGCSAFEQTSVRQWRNRMYDECLSDIQKVEEVFTPGGIKKGIGFLGAKKRQVGAAGCFLCRGQYGLHFAGTYYWIKHSSLFRRNWRNIPQTRFGPEEYIAVQFHPRELYCLRDVKNLAKITFYSEISATYMCRECGAFEAVVEDKVRCPNCRKQTSFVEKINDMGF
jgi:hypothetical protein